MVSSDSFFMEKKQEEMSLHSSQKDFSARYNEKFPGIQDYNESVVGM